MQSVGNLARSTSTFGYATAEEATRICEICGPVAPTLLKSVGRYVTGTCDCQRQARADYEQRQASQQRQAAIAATYDWHSGYTMDADEVRVLSSRTFANFDGTRQTHALDAVRDFADTLRGSLVLHGEFGTGKTHLLAALCQDLMRRGILCRFTTAPNLFLAINFHIAQKQDYSGLIRAAISAPLLVLDDIDKAKPSEFREECYFKILDSRTTAGRPTAISTNKLSELATYIGGACVSRLSIRQIAEEMIGKDYRKELW